jgi:hypothetical protein
MADKEKQSRAMKTGIRMMQFTKGRWRSIFLIPFMQNFNSIFG